MTDTLPEEKKKIVKIGRIEVDKDTCISAASCVALAPGVYRLDQDGKAEVYDAHGSDDKAILDGAMSCPVDAIYVYDEDGNLIWPKKKKTPDGV